MVILIKGRKFVVNGNTPQPGNERMRFSITLDSAPATATLTKPRFKYGKTSHFAVEWDDGVFRINNPAFPFLQSMTYTDGCGNAIPYTGALAINTGTGIPGDPHYNPEYLQAPELRQFIDARWDISNHGNTHTPVPSAIVDTNDLDTKISQRVNYRIRSTCIPNNDAGYAHAASLIDYLYATSQGDYFDEFNPTRAYKVLPVYSTLPIFTGIVRDFQDEWDNANGFNDFIKTEINALQSTRDFLRVGTHSPFSTAALLNGFKDVINYLKNNSNDKTIVCSSREFFEYLEMKLMPMTTTLAGNKLIVDIDLTNLSSRNRWRDLSFTLQSSAGIQSVEILQGITSTSFNPTTKMINIFNQKKVW